MRHKPMCEINDPTGGYCTCGLIDRKYAALKQSHAELLEALKVMYRRCNIAPDNADYRVAARSAIAKAEKLQDITTSGNKGSK